MGFLKNCPSSVWVLWCFWMFLCICELINSTNIFFSGIRQLLKQAPSQKIYNGLQGYWQTSQVNQDWLPCPCLPHTHARTHTLQCTLRNKQCIFFSDCSQEGLLLMFFLIFFYYFLLHLSFLKALFSHGTYFF